MSWVASAPHAVLCMHSSALLAGWLVGCASGGSLWRLGVHLVAEQAQAGCMEHLSSTGGPCIRYAHRHLQRMRKHDPTVGTYIRLIGK
jgi:hypothetical protein